MKKRLLSILMATSLMFTTSPTILAADKLTGPENASYNQGSTSIFYPDRGLIAPGVYAGKTKPVAFMQNEQATNEFYETTHHIGGERV